MSLTESCITIAVVSVTVAIATPSLNRVRNVYVLGSTAREVATRLQGARIAAINRNCDCRLRVVSAVSYLIECQEEDWETIEQVNLPAGITITANARPEFHPRGTVSPAATIILSNDIGRSSRVVVNLNGRVRVQ